MKKSKVNATHDKNKNENLSTPSIQHFFKSVPKSLEFNATGNSIEINNTKAVYIEALKKKLQELEHERNDVTVEQEEIQNDANDVEQVGASAIVMVADVFPATQCTGCKYWEAKYKNIKKDYMKMGTNYAELRIKYDDLLATKTYASYTNQSDINDPVSSNDAIFTPSEITTLQGMALDKKTDSTFVLRCLEYAYKHDISSLLHKTLKGKPESMIISDDGDVAYMPGKDSITPRKIKLIRELFTERINKCNLKPAENEVRIKDSYMNKLIASGITNIGKKTSKNSE